MGSLVLCNTVYTIAGLIVAHIMAVGSAMVPARDEQIWCADLREEAAMLAEWQQWRDGEPRRK